MAFLFCCVRSQRPSASKSGSPRFEAVSQDPVPESTTTRSGLQTTISQETFFDAAENGERDEVRRHVESGFDVNVTDQEDGYTALLLASESGRRGVVEELVSAGASLDAKDSFGRTPLYAASVAGHKDVVETLARAGADTNASDDDGRTPFWASLALRNLDVASLLIQMGHVDIDARDHSGKSPLMYAVESGHADCITFLQAHGAKDAGEGRLNV